MPAQDIHFYHTSLGQGAVAATAGGICRVWLPGDDLAGLDQLPQPAGCHLLQQAAQQLEQYFQGVLQQFDLAVDISQLTRFQQLVLRQVIQIPFGTVATYGTVAAAVGAPRAARAAGAALRINPVPLIIPCHRVVAATGALTGFSAAGGVEMKKKLLLLEGVEIQGFKIA